MVLSPMSSAASSPSANLIPSGLLEFSGSLDALNKSAFPSVVQNYNVQPVPFFFCLLRAGLELNGKSSFFADQRWFSATSFSTSWRRDITFCILLKS
jgi:hypothetical protein